MAATKTKNVLKDKLSLEIDLPAYVGYGDFYFKTPVTARIKNGYSEAVNVTLTAENADGLIVPYEAQAEVPYESSVDLVNEGLFSPLYLSENDELKSLTVAFSVRAEEQELLRVKKKINVLPFDWWGGLEGNAERLAAFVRPRIGDCAHVLSDAGQRLKKWKKDAEFLGYTGTDKNTVRQIAAAIFAAIKAGQFTKSEESELSAPACAVKEGSILSEKKASPLELGVFAAACLEAARLHPVLAIGKNSVGVGLWLYDSCFLDTVTDDDEIVRKYISEGINNLSFFDVEDLFSSSNAAFTPSENHFAQKLKEHYFESFVDIRRCRIAGITPLPLRGRSIHGYELLKEEEMTDESAPAPLPIFKRLSIEGKQPKNKQWERRLLDLTVKNTLLNFTGKSALHLYSKEGDGLMNLLAGKTAFRLKGVPLPQNAQEEKFGGDDGGASMRDLIRLEQKKGILRVYGDGKEAADTAVRLMRKNKDADEETGAKILYLAMCFLKYVSKEDGKPKYAPLVLAPVDISRYRGNEEFSVKSPEGEYFVNSTLLEYLKQEFNIDVRGLGGDVSALKISEIMAMVRAETANMKGWEVVKDIYLSTFSFQRYLMWNDIRLHFSELKQNATVNALLLNKTEHFDDTGLSEDEADPSLTLTPLPADSSQFSAIELARTGASFVLHGPPGTGKSQTITNIIANALNDGKRVLFVAEKKAALDVVKKRLDQIGIGEFCLELHSNKADKADVLRRMENTLSLAREDEEYGFSERAAELVRLRTELKAPMTALHKKRRLGISVYQAILLYLQNKNAPDILDIESSFYDSLTEKKLSECKNLILSAAAAAKECGGVFNSPFENVNLTEYSQSIRDTVYCTSEVMMTEIKHLRAYLALLLEFYRQKVSTLTQKKLKLLYTIAEGLATGRYERYFLGVDEAQFCVFYSANRRLDGYLDYYYKHFKSLVELGKDRNALKAFLEAGGDYKLDKAAASMARKLSRVALHKLADEDIPKYISTLVSIYESLELVLQNTNLSKSFTDRTGNVNFKKRTDFLADLYALHDAGAIAFMDYNPDAFNGMCVRASTGYTKPVLEGYMHAYDSFSTAQDHFLTVTKADRSKLRDEDILEYYSTKAGALLDNIDMLPNWCMYKKTATDLSSAGLWFITAALERGKFSGETILAGFEKNVYKNFLEINIPADPYLSAMTVGTLEDTIEKFRVGWDEYSKMSKDRIRRRLIERLPTEDDSLSVEVSAFTRYAKSNLRGTGLRVLFEEVPTLTARIAPCMLMSPTTVAQYLRPEADQFDMVIFDEASQMTTAEAIGSIARAKQAVIVGDPKQLPPTEFFRSSYVDEENLENEDLESILDDCLALGLPERHLLWHYRSKHESLIAFSNNAYYDNRLCTFPSPDALESKVSLVLVDGTYDRGFTKRNRKETEALVAEVVRRLSDPVLSRSSIGIVTFSTAQREDIEKMLAKAISQNKLEAVAYEREEPLFVKNLENVQGDERDVILFSVCYGPDRTGRVSLNFGPLNQAGGWRRLNVAVSRAREEMVVFSTMTSAMIDLAKTSSKGVAGLKAFLGFAERGRTTLALNSANVKGGAGIGRFIARELQACGYECRCDVGASDFKVDVAVVDPKEKHKFILAIICDGNDKFSVKDRNVMQIQTLKRGNWNVIRVYTVNYFNNPKREIKRIKDLLDRLTGADKKAGVWLTRYKRPYKAVPTANGVGETSAFVTGGEHDGEIMAKLKEIVATEEPISRPFLKKRLLQCFGIQKSGSKVDERLDDYIDGCAFRRERVMTVDYFYKTDKAILGDKFRVEGLPALRKTEEDFTPFEIISFIKGALEDRVALYMDEVMVLVGNIFHVLRPSEKFSLFIRDCVALGESKGLFVRSVSDRITLA